MSNPKRIGLKERPRRTPAARGLSQRNSPYNLQVGAAELGGVIQKYGGNYILGEPRTISPGCAPHRACRERIPRTVRYHPPIPGAEIRSRHRFPVARVPSSHSPSRARRDCPKTSEIVVPAAAHHTQQQLPPPKLAPYA